MFRRLVERARAGDLAAFDQLVAEFQDAVYGVAAAALGHGEDARDVAQEALIQAWRDLSALRRPERFPGWLCRIARNRCRDLLRRRRAGETALRRVALPGADEADPAAAAVRDLARDRVLAAVGALSEPNRVVTTLFYIDGYSVNEVSAFLNLPLGTVKRRLHDARRHLRRGMSDMMRDALGDEKPGAELRARVIAELQARRAEFHNLLQRAPAGYSEDWAREWHEGRLEQVRANAAQYGIEPDETFPRMTAERHRSETFREDLQDLPRRWGLPEGLEPISLRDLCRRLLVGPLTVHRWTQEGMPVLRYRPWVLYDQERVEEWLRRHPPHLQPTADPEELRRPLLMLLTAAAAGETTAEEAEKVLMALGVEVLRPFGDPIWRDEWGAAHERERRENAAQYGLAEPARTFFGSPEGTEDREVRDLTRPLGLSPIDVIRWTRQGMPCLRLSPYVRWDAQRVSDWLAERGIVPTRHPILDLDATERFVCRAVASGEATPDEAHEVLSGWYGIM